MDLCCFLRRGIITLPAAWEQAMIDLFIGMIAVGLGIVVCFWIDPEVGMIAGSVFPAPRRRPSL
jgi:hypothetical protein